VLYITPPPSPFVCVCVCVCVCEGGGIAWGNSHVKRMRMLLVPCRVCKVDLVPPGASASKYCTAGAFMEPFRVSSRKREFEHFLLVCEALYEMSGGKQFTVNAQCSIEEQRG